MVTNELEPMKYVLVKFEKDYADEFHVYGFMIMTEEEWTNELKSYRNVKYPFTYGFGSNQELEFTSFQDLEKAFNATNITIKEYNLLKKLFGAKFSDNIYFGIFPEPPWDGEFE